MFRIPTQTTPSNLAIFAWAEHCVLVVSPGNHNSCWMLHIIFCEILASLFWQFPLTRTPKNDFMLACFVKTQDLGMYHIPASGPTKDFF